MLIYMIKKFGKKIIKININYPQFILLNLNITNNNLLISKLYLNYIY